MVISFVARGLATTNIFCYQSVASAGVVLILPGYAIRQSRPSIALAFYGFDAEPS